MLVQLECEKIMNSQESMRKLKPCVYRKKKI